MKRVNTPHRSTRAVRRAGKIVLAVDYARRPANVDDVTLGHQTRRRWNAPGTWIWSDRPAHEPLISETGFRTVQDLLQAAGRRAVDRKPRRTPREDTPHRPDVLRGVPATDAGSGNILDVLRHADGRDKADIYRRLGLKLTYRPNPRHVIAEARPSAIMYETECPRPDLDLNYMIAARLPLASR